MPIPRRLLATVAVLAAVGMGASPAFAENEGGPDAPEAPAAAAPAAPPGSATPATVASANDEATYRQALIDLSADASGPHTLNITANITLDDGTDPAYTGGEDLTINGNGFTIDATDSSRILHAQSSALITINDWTLVNGVTLGDGGALFSEGTLTINRSTFESNEADQDDGGAANADGVLTVRSSTFTNNAAQDESGALHTEEGADIVIEGSSFTGNTSRDNDGGAVHSESGGDVTVTDSSFTDNRALNSNDGGAIQIEDDPEAGALTATRTQFVGNDANGDGGAVDLDEGANGTITDSLFDDNSTNGDGGAIDGAAGITLSIDGSTFTRNTAGDEGGAIWQGPGSETTVTNSTFTGNQAGDDGGAIYTGGAPAPTVALTYATIVDNTSDGTGDNLHLDGPLTSFGSVIGGAADENCDLTDPTDSGGYNWSTDDTCDFSDPTDTENGADPELEPLGDFGGFTPTRPPILGASPLIDAIPEADCDPDVTVDQRDVTRPQDGDLDGTLACDIGAVEVMVETDEAPPPVDEGPVEAAPPFTG